MTMWQVKWLILFKIYDLQGNKIKEIGHKNNCIYSIDIYCGDTTYILLGNYNFVKSYDYNKKQLY